MVANGHSDFSPCLCIVTYCPSKESIERVKLISKHWPTWVYDNTPFNQTEIDWGDQVYVFANGKNEGLGWALHFLMEKVQQAGYQWALYFDQDTFFTENSLVWIQSWGKNHENLLQRYAILNFIPGKLRSLDTAGGFAIEKKVLINSGSIFHLETLSAVGFHNKKWFLECIDYELCLRMALKHYSMASVSGCPDLDHQIEQPSQESSRVYPFRRTIVFVGRLMQLALKSLFKGKWTYAWIFTRNALTHVVGQLNAIFLPPKTGLS